jgi:soluble lytic murein transglycosylase-like protein
MKFLLTVLFCCFAGVAAAANAPEPAYAFAASPYRLQLPKAVSQQNDASMDRYKLHVDETAKQPSDNFESSEHKELQGKPYAKEIAQAAKEARIDPRLVHAVVSVESGYRSQVRSSKGAVGLMQVLPETGKRVGVSHPEKSVSENLKAGTRYLQVLQSLFDGRLDLVLAAYNAGENAVIRHHNGIPPYAETQRYVPAVMEQYAALKAMSTPDSSSKFSSHYRLDTNKLDAFHLR